MASSKKMRVLILLCLVLMATGCRQMRERRAAVYATQTAEYQSKPVIKLIVEPWDGAALNVEIARYILEAEMGYPVEFVYATGSSQFEILARGEAHATLEVWASAHLEDIQTYIADEKTILRGNDLGVIGHVGWYIPAYVAEAHPELLTWEGFLDPAKAELFATEESGDRGVFFIADRSWGSYDADMIRNLDMQMQVDYGDSSVANSEDLLADYIEAAFAEERPIVFYFWSPHWLFNHFDLVEVQLPPYSEECYSRQSEGGIICGYPDEVLFKMYWAGLPEYAPDVYQLLENIHLSNQDQIDMMGDIKFNNATTQEAALNWIQANEAIWQQWLPQAQ